MGAVVVILRIGLTAYWIWIYFGLIKHGVIKASPVLISIPNWIVRVVFTMLDLSLLALHGSMPLKGYCL